MRFCFLQHAAHEGPGEIGTWAKLRGHEVVVRHLHLGDAPPRPDEFDVLVVMGGEMNIYQYRDWPWLRAETAAIRAAFEGGKRVVGICLGAQFIADALGGRVVQNADYELGWLPVSWTPEGRAWLGALPETSTVLHWHGDTYSLPPGAMRLAVSDGCGEQGFVLPGKYLGLQFHLEVDPDIVGRFVDGQGSWPSGNYVQTPSVILSRAAEFCDANRALLHGILDRFVA
jgi:GMP synthase-like glutamine amidotransferase